MQSTVADAQQALLNAITSKAKKVGESSDANPGAGSEIHSLCGAYQALSAVEST